MPSLRKVVEDVEYNKLPSPMKPEFAAASARENKRVKTKEGSSNNNEKEAVPSLDDTERNAKNNGKRKAGDQTAAVHHNSQKKATSEAIDGTSKSKAVLELLSDEEDINLNDLAKLKQNGTNKASDNAKAGKVVGKGATQARGAVNNSVASMQGTLAMAQAAANKTNGAVSKTIAKTGGSNSGTTANKASAATTKPSKVTATTNGNALAAPQVQHPYSSNPTVRSNANAIMQDIRMNLQQTLPQPMIQSHPFGPAATTRGLGLERWSEHRIDSAATVEDLEAIRNRLITLTKRADLRLKEMNFLKAVNMIESKDDDGGDEDGPSKEVLRQLVERVESNLTVESKTGGTDLKRKHGENKPDKPDGNGNSEKRQRSTCCPFCLDTTTPRETDEVYVCSICEEQSSMCLQCRGFCKKCRRLSCEDCLMRCDTCFSDTYCSDCMPKSGQCLKCSKSKPNAFPNGQTRPVSLKTIPVTAQPQPVVKTALSYSLHRFIITEKGALGLVVSEKKRGNVFVCDVHKNSYAELLGIKADDEICYAFSNGVNALRSCE